MPPKAKNTPHATRALRSKGPVTVVQEMLLADAGASESNPPQPPAVDAPKGVEVRPQAEPLLVKIPLRRRAKALSVQSTPVVAQEALLEATETLKEPEPGACDVVAVSDLYPGTTATPTSDLPASMAQDNIVDHARPAHDELEQTDLESAPSLRERFSKSNLPKPNSPKPNSTGSTMLERYRRRIESSGEPLYREVNGVDGPFLQRLQDASSPRGGPRAALARLTRIAHDEHSRHIRDGLMGDDLGLERNEEREDGSGEEYSRNLLECVRRIIVFEAKIRRSSNKGSQAGKNRKEMGGKVPSGGPNNDSDSEKQDDAMTCHSGDGEGSGEGETPRYIRRINLSKEDLKFATDLWEDVINPACTKFEEETGKPAEAMREAIAGVIARHVRQNNNWNIWQKVWWKQHAKNYDGTVRTQQCKDEYKAELKRHKTQEEVEAWTRELEDDLARVHALNAQTRAAKKVIDVQRELISISSRAARDQIHVLFFALSVNPYSLEAQAMSGVGVGSEEMRSLLVNNNQLPPLQLMLNDLKTKLAIMELENRKAGKLPSVSGSGCMLGVGEFSETEQLNPPTTFKLFESENVTGPSDDHDDSTPNNADQLPPLPANEALAWAVSQVQLQMDGWAPLHVFKLFVVLVEPPQGLDLSEIEGLSDYLAELLVMIGDLVENGIRMIATRCWWVLLALCRRSASVRKRADWVPILQMLKKGQKRLINWCPSVEFPVSGLFPKSRQKFRSLVNMLFNPDPARRLRLVPIEGTITEATPIIITTIMPGGVVHGCTVAQQIITVDPSSVSRLYQPMGAVREPGPTATAALSTPHPSIHTTSHTVVSASAHSAELLPMTQGLNVPFSDELQLGFDFSGNSRCFAPPDHTTAFSFPSSAFHASGVAAGHYENDAQGHPFNSSATMGSASIHQSNGVGYDPYHNRTVSTIATAPAQNAYPSLVGKGAKQSSASPSVRNDPSKRRRTGELSERVVQQVGPQGRTAVIGPPVHVASFNRPPDISNAEYISLLEAQLAAGSGGPALN